MSGLIPPEYLTLLMCAVLAVALAFFAWRRSAPGSGPFALLMLAAAEWETMRLLEGAATGMAAKIVWAKLEYPGIVAVGPLWLLFALRYSARLRTLGRPACMAIWVVPVITAVLALTNEHHGLIWRHIAPSSSVPGAPLIYTHGAWFWLAAGYTYVLMLIGTMALVRAIMHVPRLYHLQAAALLAGAALPWLANAIYLLGRSPVPGLDLTPFAFTLSGVIYTWGLFRFRLLDLAPIARDVLIERMGDGVLVVDTRGRVVDVNPAAQRLLGVDAATAIGRDVREALASWPGVIACCRSAPARTEVCSPRDALLRLEAEATPLHTVAGGRIGELLVLKDVSARVCVELELRAVNARLKAQLDENAALQRRLREEAIRDPLTGLFNRRYLHETLARELSRAARAGQPLALAVIDIDHFKDLNDRFGHTLGDRMLEAIATLLRTHTRGDDVACRFGGEEFVVVLPMTSAADAYRRVDTWRQAFAALRVAHESGSIGATLSAGVAAFPTDGADGDAVLHAADRALYAAKHAGRNRVVVRAAAPALVRRPG